MLFVAIKNLEYVGFAVGARETASLKTKVFSSGNGVFKTIAFFVPTGPEIPTNVLNTSVD